MPIPRFIHPSPTSYSPTETIRGTVEEITEKIVYLKRCGFQVIEYNINEADSSVYCVFRRIRT